MSLTLFYHHINHTKQQYTLLLIHRANMFITIRFRISYNNNILCMFNISTIQQYSGRLLAQESIISTCWCKVSEVDCAQYGHCFVYIKSGFALTKTKLYLLGYLHCVWN